MIHGDPGTGKAWRCVCWPSAWRGYPIHRRAIAHPQSNLADFYREMGDLFSAAASAQPLGGFKALREAWFAHLNRPGAARCCSSTRPRR